MNRARVKNILESAITYGRKCSNESGHSNYVDLLADEIIEAVEHGVELCHEIDIDTYYHGCSKCDYIWEDKPNYCPSCGAKVVDE